MDNLTIHNIKFWYIMHLIALFIGMVCHQCLIFFKHLRIPIKNNSKGLTWTENSHPLSEQLSSLWRLLHLHFQQDQISSKTKCLHSHCFYFTVLWFVLSYCHKVQRFLHTCFHIKIFQLLRENNIHITIMSEWKQSPSPQRSLLCTSTLVTTVTEDAR